MSHWQEILFSLHRWICIRSSPINWKHGGSHSLKPTLIISDVKTNNIHVRLSSSTARSGADLILLGFELHWVSCFELRLISDFFAPFLNRTLISDYISRVQSPDGFFPNSYAAACFEPTAVEFHQTGTFEVRSTDWATAPRLILYCLKSWHKADRALNNLQALYELETCRA